MASAETRRIEAVVAQALTLSGKQETVAAFYNSARALVARRLDPTSAARCQRYAASLHAMLRREMRIE